MWGAGDDVWDGGAKPVAVPTERLGLRLDVFIVVLVDERDLHIPANREIMHFIFLIFFFFGGGGEGRYYKHIVRVC